FQCSFNIIKQMKMKQFYFHGVKYMAIAKGGVWVIEASVDLSGLKLDSLTEFSELFCDKSFNWEIDGTFNCSHNYLTNLIGGPSWVSDSYYCSYNNLTSLKGRPDYIYNSFVCSYNSKLK